MKAKTFTEKKQDLELRLMEAELAYRKICTESIKAECRVRNATAAETEKRVRAMPARCLKEVAALKRK